MSSVNQVTCDGCGKVLAKGQPFGYMEPLVGEWLVVSKRVTDTQLAQIGEDFCDWKCLASYAIAKESA